MKDKHFNFNKVIRNYRAWGEYGPTAADTVEITVSATDIVAARLKAINELKKSSHWNRMGEHNVYVELL